MTQYYKCSCGYITKNSEYACFHNNKDCKTTAHLSAFDGNGGIIAMIKKSKTSVFVKWYESEKSLLDLYPNTKFRYSYDCDREFIKIITKAVHDGITSSYSANAPIIRNDSAEQLFEKYF